MYYGNIIFIKKTGGDGSKFPVTDKNIKIGRSDDCIIRIHNSLISPLHCQLTIGDNGQAKIKNLSKVHPTFLNNKPLGAGDCVLKHGDVLKLGERYARWEYLKSSEFYSEVQSTSGLCASLNRTPKRRYSEKIIKTDYETGKTARKSLNSAKPVTGRSKLLTRHSLPLKKITFSPQTKHRKSTQLESSEASKVSSSRKTPTRRSQNWEVKMVTPPNEEKSKKGTARRTCTPIKVPLVRRSNEKVITSRCRSGSKLSNLLPISELSELTKNTRFDEKSPVSKHQVTEEKNLSSPKTPSKLMKMLTPKKIKLNTPRKSLAKSNEKRFSKVLSPVATETKCKEDTITLKLNGRKSVSRKSSSRKSGTSNVEYSDALEAQVRSPRRSLKTPLKTLTYVKLSRLDDSDGNNASRGRESSVPTVSHSVSPELREKRLSRLRVSSTPKRVDILSTGKKTIPSGVLTTPQGKNITKSPLRRTPATQKTSSSPVKKAKRGVKRKLSSAVTSAAAAKKLKTTKPDKNKKAALLVLGKASSNYSLKVSQNSNVIKQKIVKKAIKQSTKRWKKPAKSAASTKKSPGNKSKDKTNATKSSTLFRGNERQIVDLPLGKSSSLSNIGLKSPDAGSVGVEVSWRSSEAKNNRKGSVGSKNETPKLSYEKSLNSASKVAVSVRINKSVPSRYSDYKNVSFSSVDTTPFSEMQSRGFNGTMNFESKFDGMNSRPDFTELSPTALGLTPRHIVDVFKTPKQVNRRSSSLVTPKNKETPTILKSASTSKIHRKSVRFSNTDLNDSAFADLNLTSATSFNFGGIRTPDITLDVFVSPISSKKPGKGGKSISESSSSGSLSGGSSPRSPMNDLSNVQSPNDSEKITKYTKKLSDSVNDKCVNPKSIKFLNLAECEKLSAPPVVRLKKETFKDQKSPKNDLTDVRGVRRIMATPKPRKSPRNDLTDVRGIRKLMATPKYQKSPKNDLTEIKGVKRLMESPRPQRSPKNDLTDVRGVKRLMLSLRPQRSPKNDLTDVRGVKRLMESPRPQRSPKNDLTDVRGVKRLMESPRPQRSPKNDLTDVRGVKRLMESPRPPRSPKNDLTDVIGVKRLMKSPRPQRSPKNDLTDVRGVKRLMESPRPRRSPKNDLTDVIGVKRLMKSPRPQKSPKDDLTDVTGVRRLMKSPRLRSPKNDLTDVKGVRNLMKTPKPVKSPKDDLSDLAGVKKLFSSRSPVNDLSNISGIGTLFDSPTKRSQAQNKTENKISKSPGNNLGVNLTGLPEMSYPLTKSIGKKKIHEAGASLTVLLENLQLNNIQPLITEKGRQQRSSTRTTRTRKISEKSRTRDRSSSLTSAATEDTGEKIHNVRTRSGRADKTEISSMTNKRNTRMKSDIARVEKDVTVIQKVTRKKVSKEVEIAQENKEPEEKPLRSRRAASKTSETEKKERVLKRKATLVEPDNPPKRTRTRGQSVTSKVPEVSEKGGSSKKTRVATKDAAQEESKPSPVKTRAKSVARNSPAVAKKSTRAKTASTSGGRTRSRSARKTPEKTPVSPVRTRRGNVKATKVKESKPSSTTKRRGK